MKNLQEELIMKKTLLLAVSVMALVFASGCKKQETTRIQTKQQETAHFSDEQSVSQHRASSFASVVEPLPENSTLEQTQENVSHDDLSFVPRLSGDFAFDLYRTVAATKPEKNIFLSPSSARWALGMIYAGASSTTRTEMATVLGAGPILKNMKFDFKRMNSLMSADPNIKLHIANSLWIKKHFRFKKKFVSSVRRFYKAEVFARDFVQADVIEANAWVSKKTEGKIPSIIQSFSPDDRAIVINAVYFKGKWTEQFKKDWTMDEDFHLSSGKTIKCKLMDRIDIYEYFEGHGLQAVCLPYGNKRLSMIILLPDKSLTLTRLNNMLTSAFWKEILEGMKRSYVRVRVPRWTIEFEALLNDPLMTMGIKSAFDKQKANFSGISDQSDPSDRLFITGVLQKTFIEVNEEGTEAAAVTSIPRNVTTGCRSKPPSPFDFCADHPFLYAITDRMTGEILFIGALYDPTQKQ